MQEAQVGWDPISIHPVYSWQQRVFVLYCLSVLGIAVIRSINLGRQLWFSGALAKQSGSSDIQFQFAWELCKSKGAGLKRLVVFTILATFAFFADRLMNLLAGVATEKRVGIAVVSGSLAELAAMVLLGSLVCIVLYGLEILYEGILERRRVSWKFAGAKAGAGDRKA